MCSTLKLFGFLIFNPEKMKVFALMISLILLLSACAVTGGGEDVSEGEAVEDEVGTVEVENVEEMEEVSPASGFEYVLPEGWYVEGEAEGSVVLKNGSLVVSFSYTGPQMANGLEDYDYLGVTEIDGREFETYSRLTGPQNPGVLIYSLVLSLEEGNLYIGVGYGEDALEDEEVIEIISTVSW
jgi:hypothetical protein